MLAACMHVSKKKPHMCACVIRSSEADASGSRASCVSCDRNVPSPTEERPRGMHGVGSWQVGGGGWGVGERVAP